MRAAKSRVMKDVFGFEAFRPGQEAVVDALLAGRNVLAVMPTGSGKSLCFQVPALVLDGLTLVVSPLVALMQDQVSALRLAGVAADAINSSRSRAENVAAWRRVTAGESKLLYMAPERLMTERMLDALRRIPLGLIVIDEAHCISQWGPSFRPEYADLARLRELFPGVPLAAFTATADDVTRKEIGERLFAGRAETFVAGFDRPNIRLSVEMKRDWKRQVLSFIGNDAGASGIVYCLSRKKTEETAEFLGQNGIRALPYHAGMDKAERDTNQDVFMTETGVVMVATIAFGMGIDKPDVRFVLHTDLPGSIETYYQEFGRAGRDGRPARAHLLYGLGDIRMRRLFIEQEDAGPDRMRREHKRLDALIGYCESPECRRRALLSYFGERIDPCGNCDVCLEPVDVADGTEEGHKVLSAVLRTGQRFGAAHIIDVLRGGRTEKVARFGHDRLPTYGAGAGLGKEEWRSIIRQLVAGGFLEMDIHGYGGLSIAEQGRTLLTGEGTFRYRRDTMRRADAGRRKKKPAVSAAVPEGVPGGAPGEAPGGEPEGVPGGAPANELSPQQAALFEKLKALRLGLARERDVSAFVVFHDKSLEDMARRRPQTAAEFAEVHGVGEAKLRDFAEPFLAAIATGTQDPVESQKTEDRSQGSGIEGDTDF
ncbi:MAG: DNA helicase RecQ [Proteobacteria bacterium]|nr:DNA helicase RecQ [Pseudomonadota bacterium]